MDGENTGFTDKHGKTIHYGDIVQIGLGISDRTRKRVMRVGTNTKLVNPDDVDLKYGGFDLTKTNAKQAAVVDHLHPPFL